MGDEALRDEELAVVNLEHVKRISDTFRPNSVRKNGSIQKTVVQEIWKTRLAPRFYSALMNVMFPGDAKEVSFLSFYTIYKNLAEPEAEIVFRALTIYHIATIHEPPFNYEQADEYPNAPFMNIKAYVCDVITSYLHAIIHINMKEPLGWLELKASNGIMEGNLVAAYLLKDLEAHRNEVSIGSLEIWLEKSEIYYTVSVELYLYLFGVNKTIDVKSLVPFPIVQTGKNSRTLMSLPDVLLLNSKLPKRAPRWTLAFMLDSRTGDWEKFKQAIYGKGQTLIVIQDSNGDIFGMYGSQQWVPSTGFYGNDQSFLFTLKPDVNVYESSGRNNNFQIFTETGIGLGGTEASPGLFINWTLRVGTTSPRCVTFDKFWQLSRDLVFDIKLLELWVVNEVLSWKNNVIPKDFYNTVVLWSKIGQNKIPSNICQCGIEEFGSSQAQIEETDLKYFRTSDDSSEELYAKDCVATQTSQHAQPAIFRTTGTCTSRTAQGPEYPNPQENYRHNSQDNYRPNTQETYRRGSLDSYRQSPIDNYRRTSLDNYRRANQDRYRQHLQEDARPPLKKSSSPFRRLACHKSTSTIQKTDSPNLQDNYRKNHEDDNRSPLRKMSSPIRKITCHKTTSTPQKTESQHLQQNYGQRDGQENYHQNSQEKYRQNALVKTSSSPTRRLACHKSTSNPGKTEGQKQGCGAGQCGAPFQTTTTVSTSDDGGGGVMCRIHSKMDIGKMDGWMGSPGQGGGGGEGLCSCCGVPKQSCPYRNGAHGGGGEGLCSCCGVPKQSCPYRKTGQGEGLCSCCGVPKATCPYINAGTLAPSAIDDNCGCDRKPPQKSIRELKEEAKEMKREQKRQRKMEKERMKREKKEEKRLRKEANKRRKEERKRIKRMQTKGVTKPVDPCTCCTCKPTPKRPVEKPQKPLEKEMTKKDCNCPTNPPSIPPASVHEVRKPPTVGCVCPTPGTAVTFPPIPPPATPSTAIACPPCPPPSLLDVPISPAGGCVCNYNRGSVTTNHGSAAIACPPCPPKPPSIMLYNQQAPAIMTEDVRHEFYASNDKMARSQSNCAGFKHKRISSCNCFNKVANYSVMVQHKGLEYSDLLKSVDPTKMQYTASPAIELPPSIEMAKSDSNDSSIIGSLLKPDVPILTPLPASYTKTGNILINVSKRKGGRGTSSKSRNKHFVPPCVLYLDCTKVKDMCVIIRDKYEES